MASITIRDYRPDDYDAIHALIRDVLTEYGFGQNMDAVARDLKAAAERYDGGRGALFVAELDGAVVGTVAVRAKEGTVCELKRLYLRSSARGHGLGQKLYEHAEAFARSAGYTRIWLDSSRRFAAARRLYDRNGYTLLEEVDNAWEDNIYAKDLVPPA